MDRGWLLICCSRVDLRPRGPADAARLANDRAGNMAGAALLEWAPSSRGCRRLRLLVVVTGSSSSGNPDATTTRSYCRASDDAERRTEVELPGFGPQHVQNEKGMARSQRHLFLDLEATRSNGERRRSMIPTLWSSPALQLKQGEFLLRKQQKTRRTRRTEGVSSLLQRRRREEQIRTRKTPCRANTRRRKEEARKTSNKVELEHAR